MIRLLAVFGIALSAVAPSAFAQTKTMFPPVRGMHYMVGAANNFEVEAGNRILAAGGNAVDAGVATVLTAAVTEQSRFGLGGEMPLIVKMKGKPVEVVSGVGTAPAKATPEYYRSRKAEPFEEPNDFPPIPEHGLRAAVLPGALDGLILALDRYGTLSFEQVAAPAIEYAKGFPIGEEYASFIRSGVRLLETWPASKTFFLQGGAPPVRGTMFRQPTLAKTLQDLVDAEKKTRGNRGKKLKAVRDLFYKGDIAKRVAAFSEANDGLITYDDLAKFEASIDKPVCTSYRGYEVCKPGFWSQGPVMVQALNILEGYDLKSMGHNSVEYIHTVIEAAKLAFADRDRYYGDPKFSKIPAETLLSKDYASERRKLIDPNQASMEHRPGDFQPPLPMPGQTGATSADNDTTCVNVVDRSGNIFSATPSGAWLPSVIAGDTGIPFSTRLQSFVLTDGHANQLGPGKRPRITLSPTVVLKDGEPVFALSTPGGDNQDQALLQTLLNLIDFGMSAQEAVEAPRVKTEHFYASFAHHEFSPGKLGVESRIPVEISDKLAAMGHQVQRQGDWSNNSGPTVIRLLGDGILEGGADPRRQRFIFGR